MSEPQIFNKVSRDSVFLNYSPDNKSKDGLKNKLLPTPNIIPSQRTSKDTLKNASQEILNHEYKRQNNIVNRRYVNNMSRADKELDIEKINKQLILHSKIMSKDESPLNKQSSKHIVSNLSNNKAIPNLLSNNHIKDGQSYLDVPSNRQRKAFSSRKLGQSPQPNPNQMIPVLIKDKVNNSPGFGLWCHSSENELDRNKFNSANSPKNNLLSIEEPTIMNLDKKIIDQLREQNADLITKLQSALSKYYDAEFRAKRAEELSKDYLEVTELKVKEHREMSNNIQGFEDQIMSLTEALGNARKEITRLTQDIKSEQSNAERSKIFYESVIKEKELKEEQLSREVMNLMNQIQEINSKQQENFTNTNIANMIEDSARGKRTSMIVTGGNVNPEHHRHISSKNLQNQINISQFNTNQSQNYSSNTRDVNFKPIPINDQTLKYQLEIVDLKKKITDEETMKGKLLDIIKKNKEKIKFYKNDLSKLIVLFEECSKEVKWKEDLLNQKNSMIKILKDKMKKKDDEGQRLLKNLEKYKIQKSTNEFGVEVNSDELVMVKAQPQMFTHN
jgi:hypothetical protein